MTYRILTVTYKIDALIKWGSPGRTKVKSGDSMSWLVLATNTGHYPHKHYILDSHGKFSSFDIPGLKKLQGEGIIRAFNLRKVL